MGNAAEVVIDIKYQFEIGYWRRQVDVNHRRLGLCFFFLPSPSPLRYPLVNEECLRRLALSRIVELTPILCW